MLLLTIYNLQSLGLNQNDVRDNNDFALRTVGARTNLEMVEMVSLYYDVLDKNIINSQFHDFVDEFNKDPNTMKMKIKYKYRHDLEFLYCMLCFTSSKYECVGSKELLSFFFTT